MTHQKFPSQRGAAAARQVHTLQVGGANPSVASISTRWQTGWPPVDVCRFAQAELLLAVIRRVRTTGHGIFLEQKANK